MDIHSLALFIHLVSVIVGFGAVIVIDTVGLLWIIKSYSTKTMRSTANICQPLIWLGFTGLVCSGLFLGPNISSSLTQTKLVLVLFIGLNGINLHYLRQKLDSFGDKAFFKMPVSFQLWSFVSISLSQLAWWGAIIIGFINATSH